MRRCLNFGLVVYMFSLIKMCKHRDSVQFTSYVHTFSKISLPVFVHLLLGNTNCTDSQCKDVFEKS